MAIITPSTSIIVGRQMFGIKRFDVHEMSGETGDSADRELAPPRWIMSMLSPNNIDQVSMDEWTSVMAKLRGRVNYLAMWDQRRPAPRGTMRGVMTLQGAIVKGATSMTIDTGGLGGGQAGTTLKKGDWLQIGSGLTGQLVMAVEDATADGTGDITVIFEHPIRLNAGYAGGTSVTWDRAKGHYKMTSETAQWVADGGLLMSGAAADFMEQW